MPENKRVLLLGTTGIEKAQVARRFRDWAQANLGQTVRIVDFEKEYLCEPSRGGQDRLYSFLGQTVAEQNTQWRQSWAELERDGVLNESNDNVILCTHACIVRGDYVLRPRLFEPSFPTLFDPELRRRVGGEGR